MSGFGRKNLNTDRREKRRAERVHAQAPAHVETPASRDAVTIADFSSSGARLLTSGLPPSRRDVFLDVNGLRLYGTIIWRRDNSFGLRFEETLPDCNLDELRNALEEASLYGGHFDRDTVLAVLANKVPEGD